LVWFFAGEPLELKMCIKIVAEALTGEAHLNALVKEARRDLVDLGVF